MWPGSEPVKGVHECVGGSLESLQLILEKEYVEYIIFFTNIQKSTCEYSACTIYNKNTLHYTCFLISHSHTALMQERTAIHPRFTYSIQFWKVHQQPLDLGIPKKEEQTVPRHEQLVRTGHTCAPSNRIYIAHAPETSGLTHTTSYVDATPHPSQKTVSISSKSSTKHPCPAEGGTNA